MKQALLKTYEAVPDLNIVIAVGACAISGGLYQNHQETCSGLEGILPWTLNTPAAPLILRLL
jgi:Ni,Fe-hydrogenase III small subunit